MSAVSAAQLRRYARARAEYGRRLVDAHVGDGTGCCRACGRVAPCDEAARGHRMVQSSAPALLVPVRTGPGWR